jgi:hypothetical protein
MLPTNKRTAATFSVLFYLDLNDAIALSGDSGVAGGNIRKGVKAETTVGLLLSPENNKGAARSQMGQRPMG